MKRSLWLGAAAVWLACGLSAQSLDTAEALWKGRRYQEANNEFRALVDKYPTNPDYKVRWGRLLFERFNPGEATGLFKEALQLKKDHAGALFGLALVAADDFDSHAREFAQEALAADPKLLEAQELLARLALEDNNNAKAAEEAKKALAINANSAQGKAILASLDLLADKRETPWDPHNAAGYETIANFFVLNRRYEEGIAYYRKAIELDPERWSARSQLGVNLMRLGQDEEAYKQLETCYNNGFTDYATVNSLRLMDSYKNFVTFKTDRTILKLHKKEAELLHPYFEAEMQKIIATYEKKYKMTLDKPVQIEVYPDHEDFSVRTAGMPGLGGILGVTFGYGIAMDSPSGRPPGSFHWASTMWHEMSHVFTLNATNFHVPRWFTEGMAVHEETAASPDWGDRLSPEIILAIKGKKFLPVAELDRGFVHPTEPEQVLVSYFQAGRICDYINDHWGFDTLLAMLHDFAANAETADVIRKELKIEPEEFDKRFIAFVEADTKMTVDHFDQWREGLKEVAAMAKAKDWDGVIKQGTAIRDWYTDYVEAGSIYEFLAQAYVAKNDKPAALGELERYAKIGGRNPETIKTLATYLEEAGRKKDAAAALDRLNYIYPMDTEAHQRLGALWLDLGNNAGAVREFQAVLAHNPIDPAAAHYNLARALHQNHQDEQAKDQLVDALETAPGYRPAQRLLLELSEPQPAGNSSAQKKSE